MGYQHMDTLATGLPMPIEERVGMSEQSSIGTPDSGDIKDRTSTSTTVTNSRKGTKLVSWADVIKGTSHTHARKAVVSKSSKFREVILSKQSS